VTIFRLTVRQLLSARRWLTLGALAALPSLLSLAERMSGAEAAFLQEGFPALVIGAIVPIMVLLLAGSTFANDIEEGTAVYLLTKPVARWTILLERFAAAALLAAVLASASAAAAILIQGGKVEHLASVLTAYVGSIVFGAMIYTALFLALSLLTRRGIIVGLLYVLVWESTLAGQFAGTRTLSVKEYMLTIASALDRSGIAQHSTTVTTTTAITMGVMLMLLALLYALHRLRNYEHKEQV
jgi:ABC-2 type transport system permease protein